MSSTDSDDGSYSSTDSDSSEVGTDGGGTAVEDHEDLAMVKARNEASISLQRILEDITKQSDSVGNDALDSGVVERVLVILRKFPILSAKEFACLIESERRKPERDEVCGLPITYLFMAKAGLTLIQEGFQMLQDHQHDRELVDTILPKLKDKHKTDPCHLDAIQNQNFLLHLACKHQALPEVIRFFVIQLPSAVYERTRDGKSCLNYILFTEHTGFRAFRRARQEGKDEIPVDQIIRRLEPIIDANPHVLTTERPLSGNATILHTALERECRPELAEYLFRKCPRDVKSFLAYMSDIELNKVRALSSILYQLETFIYVPHRWSSSMQCLQAYQKLIECLHVNRSIVDLTLTVPTELLEEKDKSRSVLKLLENFLARKNSPIQKLELVRKYRRHRSDNNDIPLFEDHCFDLCGRASQTNQQLKLLSFRGFRIDNGKVLSDFFSTYSMKHMQLRGFLLAGIEVPALCWCDEFSEEKCKLEALQLHGCVGNGRWFYWLMQVILRIPNLTSLAIEWDLLGPKCTVEKDIFLALLTKGKLRSLTLGNCLASIMGISKALETNTSLQHLKLYGTGFFNADDDNAYDGEYNDDDGDRAACLARTLQRDNKTLASVEFDVEDILFDIYTGDEEVGEGEVRRTELITSSESLEAIQHYAECNRFSVHKAKCLSTPLPEFVARCLCSVAGDASLSDHEQCNHHFKLLSLCPNIWCLPMSATGSAKRGRKRKMPRRGQRMNAPLLGVLLLLCLVCLSMGANTKEEPACAAVGDSNQEGNCGGHEEDENNMAIVTKQADQFHDFLADMFHKIDTHAASLQDKPDLRAQEQFILSSWLAYLEMDPTVITQTPLQTNWLYEVYARTQATAPSLFFKVWDERARPTKEEIRILLQIDDSAYQEALVDNHNGADGEKNLDENILMNHLFMPFRHRGFTATLLDTFCRVLLGPLKTIGYAIPSPSNIDLIAQYAPLIEVGAGTGYWSAVLQQQHGVTIISPFDAHPPAEDIKGLYFDRTFTHVNEGDCQSLWHGDNTSNNKYYNHTLLMVWPNNPDNVDNAEEFHSPRLPPVWDAACVRSFLKHCDGGDADAATTLILVAERESNLHILPNRPEQNSPTYPDSGLCATRELQALLETEFDLIHQMEVPTWYYSDDLTIWKRKTKKWEKKGEL